MDPPGIKVELQDSLTEEFQIKSDIVEEECQINTGIVEKESQIETEIEEEQECQTKSDIVQEECQIKTEIKEEQECQTKPKTKKEQILHIKTYILEKEESLLREVEAATQDPFEPILFQGSLDLQAKLMVVNVHKYFRKLQLIRSRATGLSMNVNSCVAEATGVSPYNVNKIRKWYRQYRGEGIKWALKSGYRNKSSKKKD